MGLTIEEISNKINFLEKEFIDSRMVIITMVIGVKMFLMDLVGNSSQMEITIRVSM